MAPDRMTGVQIFTRYAFPCLPFKLAKKEMSLKDAETIRQAACHSGTTIRADFLEKLFPDAVHHLCLYAKRIGRSPWCPDVVTAYWRHHHSTYDDDCRVKKSSVVAISEARVFVTFERGKEGYVSNPFQYPLESGHIVFVHLGVIAEVFSPNK